jgi:hypothetical protein
VKTGKKDVVLQTSQSQTEANTSIARRYVQERGNDYFSENIRERCEGCMGLTGVRGNQWNTQ